MRTPFLATPALPCITNTDICSARCRAAILPIERYTPENNAKAPPALSGLRANHPPYGRTSFNFPVAQSYTNPRTSPLLGMKGLVWIHAIDCRTSPSRSPNASSANVGRKPVPAMIASFTSSSRKVSIPQSVWWMRMIEVVPSEPVHV